MADQNPPHHEANSKERLFKDDRYDQPEQDEQPEQPATGNVPAQRPEEGWGSKQDRQVTEGGVKEATLWEPGRELKDAAQRGDLNGLKVVKFRMHDDTTGRDLGNVAYGIGATEVEAQKDAAARVAEFEQVMVNHINNAASPQGAPPVTAHHYRLTPYTP